MSASLVGSEMCIRDSNNTSEPTATMRRARAHACARMAVKESLAAERRRGCLLYTSDAADDM
eukprot:8041991-Alexandrium_andersonii.AAC.1